MATRPLLEPEVAFLHQAARIPVVTNGNVTLSTATPATEQRPCAQVLPGFTAEAVVWGPGLPVEDTSVPDDPWASVLDSRKLHEHF